MNRKRMTALVALQLFAALAFAAPLADSQAPGASRASDSAASNSASFGLRASNPSTAQRRRRRSRRLRMADALLPGVWGGEHIRFDVNEGGARIELDCAHASVEGKVYVDGSGRFSAAATYQREHGGPVREEEEARGERVMLSGRVGGSLMSLTITRGREKIGTYSLTRDREAHVVKCR
ncbi:MAG TPA: hypothetical protein VGP08_03970 [Pyrinomonadaceae bacterium]|nr:hypothetical protein [Pyrinomonadaceae bacterium]